MKYTCVLGQLHIDGIPAYNEGKMLCGTTYRNTIKVSKKLCSKANAVYNDEFPLTIENFTYNGFMGQCMGGVANYRARFKSWTNDPGVAECDCSDGKTRYIPTFAMDLFFILPKQPKEDIVLFGTATQS